MSITKEQLIEALKDDAGKAAFSEVVSELGFKSADDIKGLENKNRELLGINKKIKDEYNDFKTRYDGIDPEAYQSVMSKTQKPDVSNDVEIRKIKQQLEQIAKEKDEYKTKLEGTTKKSSIYGAISKAGFDARYNDALYALFDRQAKVQQDGNGNYSVIVDDGTSVDSIEDYITKYSKSDNGKAFMPIPDHKGAGSKGFAGSTSKTMKRSDWEQLSGTEKVKAGKEYQIID